MKKSIIAIIPAAGSGQRLSNGSTDLTPKQYRMFLGQPMLLHTASIISKDSRIEKIVIAVEKSNSLNKETLTNINKKITLLECGGKTRMETVFFAINESKAYEYEWILVHDASRPGLTLNLLSYFINICCADKIGSVLAIPISNTVKLVKSGRIISTVDRNNLWCSQTPQMFKGNLLFSALQNAMKNKIQCTDESSAMEYMGYRPVLVQGSLKNLKITWPDDIELVEKWTKKI